MLPRGHWICFKPRKNQIKSDLGKQKQKWFRKARAFRDGRKEEVPEVGLGTVSQLR